MESFLTWSGTWMVILWFCACHASRSFSAEPLPETDPLIMDRPLDEVMVQGISEHAERELYRVRKTRNAPWLPTQADQAPQMHRAEALQKLRETIGVPEIIPTRALWQRESNSADVEIVQQTVRDGIHLTAYRFTPKTTTEHPQLNCILLSDPDEFPDQERIQRLVASGYVVYCPVLLNRDFKDSVYQDERTDFQCATNLPHREYVYRAGFNVGCHPVGYEVEKVLALAATLRKATSGSQSSIVVWGSGEGGLMALIAGALGEDSIDAVAISGYFGPREHVWREPIYRNIFGQLTHFGDAELASLIAPRSLIISPSPAPEVAGPPNPDSVPGRRIIAAPGSIRSPQLADINIEFERAQRYYDRIDAKGEIVLLDNPKDQANQQQVLAEFRRALEMPGYPKTAKPRVSWQFDAVELGQFQQQALREMITDTQRQLQECDNQRAKLWKPLRAAPLTEWNAAISEYWELVHASFIGKLPPVSILPAARSRQVIAESTHTGYEVTLNVYDDHSGKVIAGGVLLLPTDLQPGERRPVVVCQHGLEGTPWDTITMDESERAFRYYKGFATQLVKRGFIVYAPQNPYRGKDDFRVIQRKANPLGRSLFSYIIEQHRQTLRWLASLPNVDSKRIAFYGLSYGGKTAMRVPQLLVPSKDDVGYCLSICSADFNDWIRKNASIRDRYSYVYTGEYEIFEWNMGHVANYAELGTLMLPRPFMVERGHHDGVAPDEWVAAEYAKVRRDYVLKGIGERTDIEWFDGPHSINADGTFRFLHRHLNWPGK